MQLNIRHSYIHMKVSTFPCGTCGKSTSTGSCAVTITKGRGGSSKVASSCPEFSGISYASALKGSTTTPCTNVPIICELCVQPTNSKLIPAVWRYNLAEHVQIEHPGHTQSFHFSPKFWELISIPIAEQIAMGIPQEQIPPIAPATMLINVPNSPQGIKHRATDNQQSPRRTKSARKA